MVFLAAILGWLGGMLVNYLSDVLPWVRRLAAPYCLACERRWPWANYFVWPRRCSSCGYRRSWRTWVIELIFILAAVVLWLWPPLKLGFWLGLGLLIYFGVVVVIDLEHKLILHPVSLVGAIIGLAAGTWIHSQGTTLWAGAITSIFGGMIGFGCMWLLYLGGESFVRWMLRRRGETEMETALGFGDVNLAGVLGLLLGSKLIGLGLFLAILIGGGVSLVYLLLMGILRRYRVFTALPYGPYLVAGAVLILYFRGWLLTVIK